MNGVVVKVKPLDDFILEAVFTGGDIRHYDCKALIDEIPAFLELKKNPEIFDNPLIVSGGYGIVWNEDLDVASEEIWDNGKAVTPIG